MRKRFHYHAMRAIDGHRFLSYFDRTFASRDEAKRAGGLTIYKCDDERCQLNIGIRGDDTMNYALATIREAYRVAIETRWTEGKQYQSQVMALNTLYRQALGFVR